ncbi:MAG: trypsin-like peptidase domain-containing protein [Granulosicoccus sp.]|nr:trypsin-like peptidase domain-containing protein [Granulosicoccus sp.]
MTNSNHVYRPSSLLSLLLLFLLPGLLVRPALALEDRWAQTLSVAADSVVSLQLAQLRNFDDSEQGGSTATGFVVDAQRGIILTNRHVVGSGPVRLTATFQNQERVDAVPLYRDPIHDFAFIQYDPDKLEYADPLAMRLRPDKVSTGLNIRVLGSDGGEQLSILTGTIARLDREAPSYGRYGYNDFNTFYFQAASSTSGGSSGSPVIDFDGDVVALNAAANTRTASSFFLPLHRIQRALINLQTDQPNSRGGLQTLFKHKSYRFLRRLGLDETIEDEVRSLDESNNGMLMVSQVLPGGVADELMQAGDILLRIEGKIVATYLELETLLDDAIGEKLSIDLLRQGETVSVEVGVADLHAIMPDEFIELGDSVLQDMSIQHSRAMNLPQSGVVVMRPGYLFTRSNVPQSSVIRELNGEPVTSIDDFLSIVRNAEPQQKMLARFVVPGREFTDELAQLELHDRWFENRRCKRVDGARFWDCEKIDLSLKGEAAVKGEPTVPSFRDPLLNRVAPAMVRVDFHIPYTTDNVYAHHFTGVGLVIDRERGLVVVDRNTVPIGMGDTEITFFGSTVVDANVVFLHPIHNIALLQFDTAELKGAEFDALHLADIDTALPDQLSMLGYRADGTFRKHTVDDMSRLTVGFNAPSLPRFQQDNVDVFGVPNLPPSLGGPFVDENGDVHAIWMSFAYQEGKEIQQNEWAMPAYIIKETLRLYREGQNFRSSDADLAYRPLALARELGLPDQWLDRFLSLDAEQRRVLYIQQLVPGTDASKKLAVGDVLLAVDGELVADLFKVEQLTQKPSVELTLLRAGEVISVDFKPSELNGLGTQRIVNWAGATFQEPHWEIARFKGIRPEGVYITDTMEGSPSLWDYLYRNRFVTAVDGVAVSNLDEFLAQVSAKNQDEITRLSLVSMGGREAIVSVQPEYNFWPTFEIVRDRDGWKRIDHVR